MVEHSRLGGVLKCGRGPTNEVEWEELGSRGSGVVPAGERNWRECGFVAEVAGWCVPNWRFAICACVLRAILRGMLTDASVRGGCCVVLALVWVGLVLRARDSEGGKAGWSVI